MLNFIMIFYNENKLFLLEIVLKRLFYQRKDIKRRGNYYERI